MVTKLLILLLFFYVTKFSGRAWESLLDFIYCQYNKAQWKNLRVFLKFLGRITRYLLFLLFIYLIFCDNNIFLTIVNNNFL